MHWLYPFTSSSSNPLSRQIRRCLLSLALIVVGASLAYAQAKRITDEDVARDRHIKVEQVRELKLELGASNELLGQLSEPRLRHQLLKLRYPDIQRQRAAFMLLPKKNEQGAIPINALPKAFQQLKSFRLSSRSNIARMPTALPTGGFRSISSRLALPPTAGLFPDHSGWESLGPTNIGGRIRSIVIDPTNPNSIWIGSVGGGVWRSMNGGKSFSAVDDLLANLAVSTMVMDLTNPKVIYAGTGEGFYNFDSIRGAGIFRTIDGSKWEQLPSTVSVANAAKFQYVNRVAISADGRVLLAATRSGLFRSEDPNRVTWAQKIDSQIAFVAFNPADSTKAVAAGFNGECYFSTNAGNSWTPATHLDRTGHEAVWTGRVELAYASRNPQVVYASVNMNSGEIWKSTDGGQTYVKQGGNRRDDPGSPAGYLGGQGWYANTIWAGDADDKVLIVGGLDLWRSDDGGDSLTEISSWWSPRSAHADHHTIVSDSGYGVSNKRMFFGNDGGIFATDDASTVGNEPGYPKNNGWISLNSSLSITQFFGAAANSSGVLIGGAQDNGTLRYDTSAINQQWSEIFGGDGGGCASDPTDPSYFYGEYVFLNIHRNTDGGATAEALGDRYISGLFWNPQKINQDGGKGDWDWKLPPYRIEDAMTNSALFIAPFVLDPNNPERILAGGLRLWRTNNAKAPNDGCTGDANAECKGPEWLAVKKSVGSKISSIAVARGNPDVIWVGHIDGEIYRTTEGTRDEPNWLRMDTNGQNKLPGRDVTHIAIDPADSNTVYATLGGFEKGNVWKTVDGGMNWTNLGTDLPEAPVYALAIHPANSQFVYVGSEVGVFASEDGGRNWSPTNEGPTSCAVKSLFWMGNKLVAVTHGRGMFRIDLSLSSQ